MKTHLVASSLFVAIGLTLTSIRGNADITALPAYTVIDLGTLGGETSEADAINDSGVVVGSADIPSGFSHGFRYSGSLPIQDLGKLVGEASGATDINASGVIVGSGSPGVGTRVVVWNGGPATVPAPFASINGTGYAINDSNSIVGNLSLPTLFRPQAMLHTLGSASFTDIGALLAPLGVTRSVAFDVNESNEAVGWVILQDFSIPARGFRFAPPDHVELLPTLGIYDDFPRAINDQGLVVGRCGVGPGEQHACTWSGGVLTTFNPFGGLYSNADGVNNKGEIVGSFVTAFVPGGGGAFLRTGGQTFDLNDLIPAGSGWQLENANDINEHSQIVGRGLHNGLSRAFLLTPTTMPGANVVATPIDATAGATPVQLTFEQVTQGGVSTVTTSASGPPPPAGFAVGTPSIYYEIATTVAFTGSVQVCIDVTGIDFGGAVPSLNHYESGSWVTVPSTFDAGTNTICGSVTSLSPFAVFRPQAATYTVRALYDATRAARRGSTLPIKIELQDAGGVNVSSAALVLTARRVEQVSTSAPGELADSGRSNPDGDFRYDAALGSGGGYVFNLSTSGLSTGTYLLFFTVGDSAFQYSVEFQVK